MLNHTDGFVVKLLRLFASVEPTSSVCHTDDDMCDMICCSQSMMDDVIYVGVERLLDMSSPISAANCTVLSTILADSGATPVF